MEQHMERQSGFTLVELAIVMIIIGLLIGGVLKGQQLIENAKVTATINQIKAYEASFNSFRDTYASIPGDMANAQQRIAGCGGNTAAGNFCVNGNGDGIIGTPVNFWEGGQHEVGTENTQFWKHLALADLITGIEINGNVPAWGVTHPASKMRGGYTMAYSATADGSDSPNGLWARLHSCLTCSNIETTGGGTNGPGTQPISPLHASIIDRKMDDGMPSTGVVRSFVYGDGAGCEDNYSGSTKKDCTMGFRIGG